MGGMDLVLATHPPLFNLQPCPPFLGVPVFFLGAFLDHFRFPQQIRWPDLFTFSPVDWVWLAVAGGCYLSTSTRLRCIGMTGFLWVVGQQLANLLAQVSQYHRLVVIV